MKGLTDRVNCSARRVAKRYAQFCFVGSTGVVVDMGLMWLLASPAMLGWNLTISKVIGAEVAIFNNFFWNDVWTFRDLGQQVAVGSTRIPVRNWGVRLVRLGKFNLICVAGIFLSVGLLNLQVYRLGLNVYLANFVAIVATSFWNFFLNLKFGWKTTPTVGAGRDPA
jgi:dolichol-phosphate mannosyltransferase